MTTFRLRLLPVFASLAVTAGLMGVATDAAYASRGAPEYRITLDQAASGTHIARETVWRCAEQSCTAARSTSRPEVTCAHAAREIGKIANFEFRGEALGAEALAKCNERAR
jgi:hypothetical protein